LEEIIGQKTRGTGFFCRCLAKDRGITPEEKQLWRDGIYAKIRGWVERKADLHDPL